MLRAGVCGFGFLDSWYLVLIAMSRTDDFHYWEDVLGNELTPISHSSFLLFSWNPDFLLTSTLHVGVGATDSTHRRGNGPVYSHPFCQQLVQEWLHVVIWIHDKREERCAGDFWESFPSLFWELPEVNPFSPTGGFCVQLWDATAVTSHWPPGRGVVLIEFWENPSQGWWIRSMGEPALC